MNKDVSVSTIPEQRMIQQLLASGERLSAADVVRWMGMLQAQDYLAALWAVGLRASGATEASLEQALAERKIVRTWPARGTLHFVAPEDTRWLLRLLTPRVISLTNRRYLQLGLDGSDFERSRMILTRALSGGNILTRPDAYQALEVGGVSTEGQRGIHILGRLAMEGLICFGPRQGKQQTFVLLEEWLPQGKTLDREGALMEITRRYFTSHGPATIQDFAWWSGLTLTDARAGLELAAGDLVQDEIDGRQYYRPLAPRHSQLDGRGAHLLPAFDEYLVGYSDRSAVLDPQAVKSVNAGGGMLSPVILIDGRVAGTWKRTLKKDRMEVSPAWFEQPGEEQVEAFWQAAALYAGFLGLELSA